MVRPEQHVREIGCQTYKKYSTEENIQIVILGLATSIRSPSCAGENGSHERVLFMIEALYRLLQVKDDS